ncbi:MAG TPA: hypothetical protein VKT53_10530, partial [Candidatus Acidoferrum sp.]|nr:hypothetical protein [Candidatus Acidoferrum sp.]
MNYDSLIWTPVASGGTTSWQPSSQWGWSGLQPAGLSFVTYSMVYTSGNCGYMGQSSYQEWQFSNFAYYDSFGVWHSFPNVGGVYFISPGGNCPPNGAQPPQSSQTATDGSAYTLYVNIGQFPTVYLTDKNGNTINVQSGTTQPSSGDTSTSDRNGNLISQHNGVYTDTLGTNALSVVASANTTFS